MKKKTLRMPRGVIKVKQGYNPNSSSIGSLIYSLPFAFVAMSGILAICAAFISRKPKDEK